MLQPYRILIYHEQAIRDQYEILNRKFGTPDDLDTLFPESLTKASKRHETTQEDEKQEVPVGPDAGVRPSQESETGTEPGHKGRDETQSEEQPPGMEGTPEEPKNNPGEYDRFPLANSKTALGYLSCLIDFMDSTISIRRQHVQSTQCRKVDIRDLWYLFSPGDEVIRRGGST